MRYDLVVFDVDGTLTVHHSIWWRLHEHFGTADEGRKYFDQYFAGEIDYHTWADLDAGLWTGRHTRDLRVLAESTEIVPGALETIRALKENKIKVAILSGGLDFLANSIAERLGIDYVLTNKLEVIDDIITGQVEVLVGWGEKVQEILQIIEHFETSLERTVFIGDGKNDMSVFPKVGLSIAFRPENDEVAEAAQVVIRDNNLKEILPYILRE